MLDRKTKIHLVGVGGIGMSALAQVYADRGYTVSGSDLTDSSILDRLRKHGVVVSVGQKEANVAGADLVVCSTAIREDNPERLAAARAQIPIWKRAQLLADVLSDKRSIVVTGCHGKTTTSSMIAWMLSRLDLDPTILVGGEVEALGGNAVTGAGPWIVAEGDESDRSFLYLQPDIAVVTNVDFDHPDHYQDLEDVRRANIEFLSHVRPGGTCVLCFDDEMTRHLVKSAPAPVLGYGFAQDAEIRATNWREEPSHHSAEIVHGTKCLGTLSLQIAGRFNMQNALAAVAVARVLELDFDRAAKALADFPGVHRRMEFKGSAQGVAVYDDYGHHPKEIAATLQALHLKAPGRKIVVFQPHRYNRTQRFAEAFARELEAAETLIVTGIYAAGDRPIPGVSGRSIFDRIPSSVSRSYCETLKEAIDLLARIVQPGDTLLTIGAGDVHRVGEQLLANLQKRSGETK